MNWAEVRLVTKGVFVFALRICSRFFRVLDLGHTLPSLLLIQIFSEDLQKINDIATTNTTATTVLVQDFCCHRHQMSRCSSFPPPGYDKNGLTGDSLIHWYRKMRREAKKRYKRKRKLEKKRSYRCCGMRRGGERKKGEYLRRQDGEMEDSERSEITEQEEEEEAECGECSGDKKKGDEWLLLRDQIESWKPAKLQIWEQDCDDLEWLFGMKQSQKQRSKKVKTCDYASFHGSSSLWHCARYLPDCDIYALPFTVLF